MTENITTDTPDVGPSASEVLDEGKKIYEVSYWLVPLIAEEGVPAKVTEIKDALTKFGATLVSEEMPKMQPIAYNMKKVIKNDRHTFSNGYFGWIKFEGEIENTEAIGKWFKDSDDIIRHLVISTVRGDTRAPKKLQTSRTEGEPATISKPGVGAAGAKKDVKESEKPAAPISEAELDKTIEELVVE
ncbi:hypothetical protein COB55_00530 [Candidatus Wolfebacteria bacterium]|nr:MAG: hypothetical protein COB55_00530 [Candidatus Wolfebacteria bacterium]